MNEVEQEMGNLKIKKKCSEKDENSIEMQEKLPYLPEKNLYGSCNLQP